MRISTTEQNALTKPVIFACELLFPPIWDLISEGAPNYWGGINEIPFLWHTKKENPPFSFPYMVTRGNYPLLRTLLRKRNRKKETEWNQWTAWKHSPAHSTASLLITERNVLWTPLPLSLGTWWLCTRILIVLNPSLSSAGSLHPASLKATCVNVKALLRDDRSLKCWEGVSGKSRVFLWWSQQLKVELVQTLQCLENPLGRFILQEEYGSPQSGGIEAVTCPEWWKITFYLKHICTRIAGTIEVHFT